jgi:hypothetical protein
MGPAPAARRIAVYLLGPLLWLVALIVVAFVVRQGRAVGVALLVTAATFLLATLILVPLRRRRVREEAEAR